MMQADSSTPKNNAFLSPEEGEKYPLFDITGENRREQHLLELLNDVNKAFQETITHKIREVMGSRTPRATVSAWGVEPSEDLEFWLSSTTSLNKSPEHPVLAISKKSLVSFTEVFFSGDPNAISESQIQHATMTSTDDRQLSHLYEAIVDFLSTNLGFDASDWRRKWMDHAPEIELLWSKITVSSEEWSFDLFFGFPLSLSYEEDTPPRPTIDGSALIPEISRVPVKLSLDLGSAEATLSEIDALKKGDILGFDINDTVIAKAGRSECLAGHICEVDGQLCLRITKNMGTE